MMNGTNLYSDSMNGTPTPSSTSYPASLSSESSRDASPSRLLNHVNQEKHFNSSNNYFNFKNQDSSSNSNFIYGQLYREPINANMPSNLIAKPPNQNDNDTVPAHDSTLHHSQRVEASQSSISALSHIPSPTTTKSIYTSSFTPVDPTEQKSRLIGQYSADGMNMNEKSHDNVGLRHLSAGEYSEGHGGPGEQYSHPTNQQPDGSHKIQQSYNWGAPVPVATGAVAGQRQLVRPSDRPISSGPPRTNVLGIIPYATEPVTSQIVRPKVASEGTYYQQPSGHPAVLEQPSVDQQQMYQLQNNQVPQQQLNGPQLQSYHLQTAPHQQNYHPQNGAQPQAYQPHIGTQMSAYPNGPEHQNYQLHTGADQQGTRGAGRGGRVAGGYPPPPYQPYPNYQQQPQQQVGSGGRTGQALYSQPPVNSNLAPTQAGYYPGPDDLANQVSQLSVAQSGYNKLWGRDALDLLKCRDILPAGKVEPPPVRLSQEYYETSKCSPEIFRCTMTKIPETKSLLDKSRLPLGVLIHPFKDLNQLSVIQCTVIVRCRACRTYINPFVFFVDSKHWKCNLCFRVNDLPEEFQYDPLTKTYGDPSRRPEIKSATIEFIAPSEYMVRPPQPAAYVFILDVSRLAIESGYVQIFCECLLSQLEALPGDSRTSVAFISFDSTVHYYSLAETQTQPHQMVIVDIDDIFVPTPDSLLVNLNESLGLVRDLLRDLPSKYSMNDQTSGPQSYDTGAAVGSALQAAYKLLAATGGRVSLFTACLATSGPGALSAREDRAGRSGDALGHAQLNPTTDFYKKLALDCSGQQIAVDLFLLNSQFVDLASLSGISRFSGGCMHHFPLFCAKRRRDVDRFQRCLQRYLCRKIGFESVMRLRCTRGLSIHTFHGNFFVRSTDLLSLPNVNPDAGFGMQVSIDENLTDIKHVCFQAALLYTSSKGERRIRVHTLCLPIASNISDILHSADQQCIIGLLAKMAVDRCQQSSVSDAREAFVNVVADMLSAFKITQSSQSPSALLAPSSLALLPLYVLALLKYSAFRVGGSTRLDDRFFTMCQIKSMPLAQMIQAIYPDLYPVHNIAHLGVRDVTEAEGGQQGELVVDPPVIHLSAERIDSEGIYLMDDGDTIIIYIGHNLAPSRAIAFFGESSYSSISNQMGDVPEVDSIESRRLRTFISYLQNEKPVPPTVQIIKDDSPERVTFIEKLIEDKTEYGHSYYEFLQRIKVLVK